LRQRTYCLAYLAHFQVQCLLAGLMALFANLLFAELHRQGQSIRVEVHFEDLPVKNVEIVLIGLINCQTDWTDALLGKTLDIHLPAGGML